MIIRTCAYRLTTTAAAAAHFAWSVKLKVKMSVSRTSPLSPFLLCCALPPLPPPPPRNNRAVALWMLSTLWEAAANGLPLPECDQKLSTLIFLLLAGDTAVSGEGWC